MQLHYGQNIFKGLTFCSCMCVSAEFPRQNRTICNVFVQCFEDFATCFVQFRILHLSFCEKEWTKVRKSGAPTHVCWLISLAVSQTMAPIPLYNPAHQNTNVHWKLKMQCRLSENTAFPMEVIEVTNIWNWPKECNDNPQQRRWQILSSSLPSIWSWSTSLSSTWSWFSSLSSISYKFSSKLEHGRCGDKLSTKKWVTATCN